ncbi:MAG: hypothetical protein AB1422_19235, partial [bacterium]
HCNFDICILIFTLKFFLLSLSPKEEPIYEKAIRFAFLLARSEVKASHYKSLCICVHSWLYIPSVFSVTLWLYPEWLRIFDNYNAR